MPASYMNYYTAYEVITLDGGTGKGVCVHNLGTKTGIKMAKQHVTLTPIELGTLPPAIDEAASPQTDDQVAIIGDKGAKVKVTVQAVHSINQ